MTKDLAKVRLFGAVVRPLQVFLRLEAASGIVLLASAVLALLWANLDPSSYREVFQLPVTVGAGAAEVRFTVRGLIDEGLMTIFFFVVGMEIKSELVTGELNSVGKAVLPALAALGGMIVPAALFLAGNAAGPGRAGWGVPVATDIAFCVGILTLLGDRVPHALVVFVTALAIFDDIGGILIIAFFYGHGLSPAWLLAAGGIGLLLLAMNRAHVVHGFLYAVVGASLWSALDHAGIHATIAGVALGLAIPARPQRAPGEVLRVLNEHVSALASRPADEELEGAEVLTIQETLEDLQAPLQRFVLLLHPLVAFVVMPLFALANAGVWIRGVGLASFGAPVALGTAAGLFVGKQVGIFGATLLAVKLGVAPIPGNASRLKLYGASVVAGIGFTVALFIAGLAFDDAPGLLDQAKIGILVGSAAAGLVGYALLRCARA